jgi:hypothetical protein
VRHRDSYAQIFVAYGDCGTGGQLDLLLAEEGIERLPGAHCYEFFATAKVFEALADAEPGTFYLTDFLLKNFERFVVRGLGLDRHPELKDEYFRNYHRLVYLAQTVKPGSLERAAEIAAYLGLAFEHHFTGYGELGTRLRALAAGEAHP